MSTPSSPLWNVPNTLTMLRVVFSLAIFVLLLFPGFCVYAVCLVLFIIAALTDYVDGYWARKYNLVSVFGRIMDPFADKLLICGCFIYLAAIPELRVDVFGVNIGIHPWMAVAIVAREMLITSLRAVVESSGGDFSAKWIGKWKMGLQCVAIPACFLYLMCRPNEFIKWCMIVSLWGTVLITLYSGVSYTFKAVKVIKA